MSWRLNLGVALIDRVEDRRRAGLSPIGLWRRQWWLDRFRPFYACRAAFASNNVVRRSDRAGRAACAARFTCHFVPIDRHAFCASRHSKAKRRTPTSNGSSSAAMSNNHGHIGRVASGARVYGQKPQRDRCLPPVHSPPASSDTTHRDRIRGCDIRASTITPSPLSHSMLHRRAIVPPRR